MSTIEVLVKSLDQEAAIKAMQSRSEKQNKLRCVEMLSHSDKYPFSAIDELQLGYTVYILYISKLEYHAGMRWVLSWGALAKKERRY